LKLQLQLSITIYGQQNLDADYNIFAKEFCTNGMEQPNNDCVVDYKRERKQTEKKDRCENLE
jgi:hypothetical protein